MIYILFSLLVLVFGLIQVTLSFRGYGILLGMGFRRWKNKISFVSRNPLNPFYFVIKPSDARLGEKIYLLVSGLLLIFLSLYLLKMEL